MTNVVDILTRKDIAPDARGRVSGEARQAVAQILCPYGVAMSTVDLFLSLLWSQGYCVTRRELPPVDRVERPCDSEDDGA